MVFNRWMRAATTAQQERLAKLVGTSRAVLYLYGQGAKTPSVRRAAAIERAAPKVKGDLPPVTRGDINPECAACPYFKACKGATR